jgi:branched-chain amino acid transport system substrate-binding protein
MSKRTFTVLSLLVVAGMILAACQPAAAPFTCSDPLGCVDVQPGAPIHIAYGLVIAGPNETLGIDSRRGIEIAIDDVKNTVLGHPLSLTGEDTGCSAEGGQAAAQKLAADKSIVAVIGTSCSSEARVLVPILSDLGVTVISPSNTAPDLTDPASREPFYFRTAHNDLVQGKVAAEFAYNNQGVRKAATIHDGSPYAEGLANSFANTFKKLGGEIVAQEAVQVGATDMKPVLTAIASKGPELIFYPIFVAEGGFVTAQAREIPELANVKLMGADGIFSTDFLKAAGPAAVGMFHSSPDFSAFGDAYKTFLDEHQKKYGEKPISAFHAHAYDAANIIFAALQKAAVQESNGTLHIPRTALKDAVAATKDFKGLTGNLICNETIEGVKYPGDCGDPHIAVYQTVSADPASWNPGAAADSNPKKIYP